MCTFHNCITQKGMYSLTHHLQNKKMFCISQLLILIRGCSFMNFALVTDTNLVGFGEEAGRQHRVFWGLQAVGGALWHDNVHGYVTHCVEFLYRKTQMSGQQDDTQEGRALTETWTCKCSVYLVGLRIIGRLGIFCLLDIFHHFSYEGVTVIFILGHYNFKNKPQSPEKEGKFDINIQNSDFLLLFCSIPILGSFIVLSMPSCWRGYLLFSDLWFCPPIKWLL